MRGGHDAPVGGCRPRDQGCLLVFLLVFSRIADWSTFSGQSLVLSRRLCRAVSIEKEIPESSVEVETKGNLNVCDIVIFFLFYFMKTEQRPLFHKAEKLSWSYPSQTTETFLSLKITDRKIIG